MKIKIRYRITNNRKQNRGQNRPSALQSPSNKAPQSNQQVLYKMFKMCQCYIYLSENKLIKNICNISDFLDTLHGTVQILLFSARYIEVLSLTPKIERWKFHLRDTTDVKRWTGDEASFLLINIRAKSTSINRKCEQV